MPDVARFDVILVGFRNDLARARTIEFLQTELWFEARPTWQPNAVTLPHCVWSAVERAQVEQLRAQLESLGAQVVVRPANHGSASEAVTPDRARSASSAFLLLLTAGLVVAGYWLGDVRFAPHVVPPRAKPEAARVAQESAADPPPAEAALPSTIVTTIRSEPMSQARIDDPEAQALNNEAVRLAEAGRFDEAVHALEAAQRLARDEPVVLRNLQTVLLNWGVADLAAGRLGDAELHLHEANRLGERLEVLQALGITLLREGQFAAAVPLLERALELAPSEPASLLALADAYVNQDRRPEALELLHRAREAGVRSPELDRRVAQLGREVDAEWDFVQEQDPHFRVSFADDEENRDVEPILDALDDAYYTVGEKLDYYPDGRTPVVLYTQQDFHSITQTPDWAGGAFDGRIKIPVRGLSGDDPNLARVVRHEYAHSLVAQLAGPHCPVWLNEGLAVWAEEVQEGERVEWAQQRIAGHQLFGLDQLNNSFMSLPSNRIEVAYAQSYLAVRKLIDDYGERRLGQLLKSINRYGNSRDAFVDVYREDIGKFQQRLLRELTT